MIFQLLLSNPSTASPKHTCVEWIDLNSELLKLLLITSSVIASLTMFVVVKFNAGSAIARLFQFFLDLLAL